MGANPPAARVKHLLPGGNEQRLVFRANLGINNTQHVLAGQRRRMAVIHKIARLRDAEIAHGHIEFLRRQPLRQFVVGPAVEFALVPFAVGIFGGVIAAVGMRHVAPEVTNDVPRHVGETRLAADEIRVEVEIEQLRVVVEHFFKVRHPPFGIHRVTGETAAELIVDATGGHAVTGVQDHARGFVVLEPLGVTQQKRGLARLGKLGGAAETAVLRVVGFLKHRASAPQCVGSQKATGVRGPRSRKFESDVNLVRGGGDFAVALPPDVGDLFQHGEKAAASVTIVRRKIGAAKERLAFRGQENIQRPAAAARRGLHEGHVNLVHIRALLAVQLDADEMFPEIGADFVILERFTFHDVTPMAGRVADAQEDGFVFRARPGERLVAPREPIHGIVRVLQEIG